MIEKITVTDGNCTLSPDPSVELALAPGANKTFTCSISGTPGQQDVPNTANASGTAALTKDIVHQGESIEHIKHLRHS